MERLDQRLSDFEIDELSALLAASPDAMLLPEVEGFLTAIASAPTMIRPSEWHAEVFGEGSFPSAEQAKHVFGLVLRLYNEIITDLNEGNEIFAYEGEEDYVLWCTGYLTGARMDKAWTSDETGAVFLFPMAILSGEFDLVGEEDADGNIIKDDEPHLQRCRENLENNVHEAFAYWREWRGLNMRPVTRAPKVGRNDPCPCGSGLKFKKCCALKEQ